MNQQQQTRAPSRVEHSRRLRGRKLLPLICCLTLLLTTAPARAQTGDLGSKSRRAAQALRDERFREAIALYRELLDEVPNHPGLLMNLGLALHSAGQYKQAIEQFESAVELKPDLAPGWFFIGLDYQNLGEPDKAVKPLEQAIEVQPNNHRARLELADALYTLGRYEQASSHFKKLSESMPSNPKAWLGLGLSYASLSRNAAEKLEALAPESAYRYLLLAQSRADQQQYRSAFHYYRQAVAKHPNLAGVHNSIAEIYRETGHPDWAEEEQRKRNDTPIDCDSEPLPCWFAEGRHEKIVAPAADSDTPESLYWQARSYGELARRAHEKLAELPPSGELHQLMAGMLDVQRRHREAAEEWSKALKYGPSDRRLKVRLARSLWSGRDYEAMQPLVEELLTQNPASAELRFLLGDAFLNQQEIDEAIPHLEAAVTNDPAMLSAHASLARAYLRAGQGAEAIRHLEAALPTDEDGSLHYQLARAYQAAGQTEKAKETLLKHQNLQRSVKTQKAERDRQFRITPP